MKRICLWAVLAVGLAAAQSPQPGHVVLISIDGLAAYHLDNPSLVMPHIRELIAGGVWARSSQTVFPSVTHPSHTTLITGVSPREHGVINNQMINRETGESFHPTNKPRSQSIRVRTLFDAAKSRGLTTAAFFWPETFQDASIDFNLAEVFTRAGKADPAVLSSELSAEFRQNGIPIDRYFSWYGDGMRQGAADLVLADAAAHIIRTRQPHLLAIHLLVTDKMQHEHGPDHYLARAALSMADQAVGILRTAVREAGLQDRTTIFIVADHGFHSITRELNLYPLFRKHDLTGEVTVHPGGWTAYVELVDRGEAVRRRLDALLKEASSISGVARVLANDDFPALGLPRYEENPHVRGQFALVGDIDTALIYEKADGDVPAIRQKARPSHSHGYLPDHPSMFPALVIAGRGARQGVRIGHVSNYDVAPTIARLLDLDMGPLPGQVLHDALK